MRKAWFSLFAVVFLALPAFAGWVATGPGREVGMEKLRSDAAGLVMNVSLPGFETGTAQTPGGEFARISLPGEGVSSGIGRPNLPVIRRFVEVPYGTGSPWR